jgi:UPF0271 protein
VTEGLITSRHGVDIPVACDTILVHGDTAGAVTLARGIREGLISAGVSISPLTQVLAGKGR